MSNPYLGEVRLMSFQFAPKGWALCNGQLLPINQNQALFALLGTMYGGDGRVTFALPNLQSRTPMHFSGNIPQGSSGGQGTVQLTAAQMPAHNHVLEGSSDFANANVPGLALPAAKPRGGLNRYAPPATPTAMDASSIAAAGGSQPHENMQPYLVLSHVIALQGIFPSRN